MIQQIMVDAGLSPFYAPNGEVITNVDVLVDYANNGNGRITQVNQRSSQAGDIIVQGIGHPGTGPSSGQKHVGICLNSGCTQIMSNSSSNGTFTYSQNDVEFMNSYSPIYSNGFLHVNN